MVKKGTITIEELLSRVGVVENVEDGADLINGYIGVHEDENGIRYLDLRADDVEIKASADGLSFIKATEYKVEIDNKEEILLFARNSDTGAIKLMSNNLISISSRIYQNGEWYDSAYIRTNKDGLLELGAINKVICNKPIGIPSSAGRGYTRYYSDDYIRLGSDDGSYNYLLSFPNETGTFATKEWVKGSEEQTIEGKRIFNQEIGFPNTGRGYTRYYGNDYTQLRADNGSYTHTLSFPFSSGTFATQEWVNEQGFGSGGAATSNNNAIIDVAYIPSDNINENAIYRVHKAVYYAGTTPAATDMFKCNAVNELPTTGNPAVVFDGSLNPTFVETYYVASENKAYGYVDEILAQAGASVGQTITVGWYPVDMLFPLINIEYNGIIYSTDKLSSLGLFLLVEFDIYTCKEGVTTQLNAPPQEVGSNITVDDITIKGSISKIDWDSISDESYYSSWISGKTLIFNQNSSPFNEADTLMLASEDGRYELHMAVGEMWFFDYSKDGDKIYLYADGAWLCETFTIPNDFGIAATFEYANLATVCHIAEKRGGLNLNGANLSAQDSGIIATRAWVLSLLREWGLIE